MKTKETPVKESVKPVWTQKQALDFFHSLDHSEPKRLDLDIFDYLENPEFRG